MEEYWKDKPKELNERDRKITPRYKTINYANNRSKRRVAL